MYGVLEHEAIATAFSSIAFSGLRSLPPKLEPAFRERRRNRIGAQLASMSASSLGDHERPTDRRRSPRTASPRKMAEEVARGQVRGSHGFTEFTYLPGAFAERADMTRRPQPSLWVNPKDFVVRSSRPPPRFLNEFGNYTHSSDPFDSVVDGEKSEAEISGMMQIHQLPIKGGGRPGRGEWTLGLLDESVNGIEKDLRAHFGPRLIGVTKDVHGLIVVRFRDPSRDRSKGRSGEGAGQDQDVSAYMQQWVRGSRWASELRLVREIASWGVPVPHLGEIWYTLRGPWVHLRPAVPRPLADRIDAERRKAYAHQRRVRDALASVTAGRAFLAGPDAVSHAGDPDPTIPSLREPHGGMREFHLSRPLMATFFTGRGEKRSEFAASQPRARVWEYDRRRRGVPENHGRFVPPETPEVPAAQDTSQEAIPDPRNLF